MPVGYNGGMKTVLSSALVCLTCSLSAFEIVNPLVDTALADPELHRFEVNGKVDGSIRPVVQTDGWTRD